MKLSQFFIKTVGVAVATISGSILLAQSTHISSGERLGLLANRGTHIEGQWNLTDIEGFVPSRLDGALYRLGSGQRDNFGQILRHFNDGDAYLSRFVISQQKVKLTSKFINTPQRLEERRAGRMLYHEFGTAAPSGSKGDKNSSNQNLVASDKELLLLSGLSEPLRVREVDFGYLGLQNFRSQWPLNVTFGPHPRIDRSTGDMFNFGIRKGSNFELKGYKIESDSGKIRELFSVPLDAYHMIHDMVITDNYMIIMIPPVYIKPMDMTLGKRPLSSIIKYDSNMRTKVVVARKDATMAPRIFETSSLAVLHLGNAYEEDGVIQLQAFASRNLPAIESQLTWQDAVNSDSGQVLDFTINLKTRNMRYSRSHDTGGDYPTWNPNLTGKESQFLYFVEATDPKDPQAFRRLVKLDRLENHNLKTDFSEGVAVGEPVFVADPIAAEEDDGWLLLQGYSKDRDESFLQILSAKDLSPVARIWVGHFLPLGIHGVFQQQSNSIWEKNSSRAR